MGIRVFMSWSGATSRAVALTFASWLPKVVQGVEPFVSAKDIDKGSNWTVELVRELESAEFGMIFLAPDNLSSPWLHYEAGAITKSVDSRVCPVLFHVEKTQVQAPLSQLQLTSTTVEEITLLVQSLNKASGSPLAPHDVNEAVEVWWNKLDEELKKIPIPGSTPEPPESVEPPKPQLAENEMLEEVLRRVRSMDRRVSRLEPRGSSTRRTSSRPEGAALRYLDRIASDSGMGEPSVVTAQDEIIVMMPEDGRISDELATAAQLVSEREGVIVRIQMPSHTETWDARPRRGDMDESS